MISNNKTINQSDTKPIQLGQNESTSTCIAYNPELNAICIFDQGTSKQKPSIIHKVYQALLEAIPSTHEKKKSPTVFLSRTNYAEEYKTISHPGTVDFNDTYFNMSVARHLEDNAFIPDTIVIKKNLIEAITAIANKFSLNQANVDKALELIQNKTNTQQNTNSPQKRF